MNRLTLAGWALAALLCGLLPARAAEEAPTVVRLMTDDIVVEANGSSTQTSHVEILATNEAAAKTVGQTALQYRETAEELEIVEAYTLKSDGQKIPVAPSAIYTQQPQGSPQLLQINEDRQKVVVFPNVAAGDTVIYTIRLRTNRPAIPGHFTHMELFPPSVRYDEVRGSITVPKSLPLKVESHEVEVRAEESPTTTTHRWRYSALGSQTVQVSSVSPLDQIPRVLFSSLAGQEELGRVYASLIAPMETITPKIQALANQLTAGVPDRRLRAQTIYEWVSKNIRYVAVDIGNGGIIPHNADETLANGYGDCKDHVVLFAALLRAVGIENEAVLINVGNAYSLPQAAMIPPFNHLITWLPEFQLYVDTTSGIAPFGALVFAEYGKPVVHATTSGTVVRRTPVLPPNGTSVVFKATARLDSSGNITGDSTVTATGPFALTLRALGLAIQGTGPARFASVLLEAEGLKGTGTFDVPSPTDPRPDYTITTHFEFAEPRLVQGRGFGLIRGPLLLPYPADGLIVGATTRDEEQETACYSGHMEEELVLEVPAGQPVRTLPPETNIKTANLEFVARWSSSGNTVTVKREFNSTITEPLCTGDLRKETARALTQIRDHYERHLISYVAPSATAPSSDSSSIASALKGRSTVGSLMPRGLPPSRPMPQTEALAYFLSGDANARKGDNEIAIYEYTRALELRPDYRDALVNRGTAYAAIRKFEEAVNDFTAAVRLGPENAALRGKRGNAYQALAKFDEAADDFSVVIRMNPDNAPAYVNRAQAYLRAGLFERGIADCEAAVRLGRDTADCHRVRGFAQFILAKHEDAIASLTTSIEMQPDAAVGHYQRGLANLGAGHLESAISDFDTAIKLGTNDAASLFARGIAREKRGDQVGANADFAQANRINPRVAPQLAFLGVTRDRIAQDQDASEICNTATTRAEALRAAVYCGRVASAANASARDKASAHFAMGGMHLRKGHYPEALNSLDQAVELDPAWADAHVEKGNAHRLQDQNERAIQSYDEAIKLAPFSAAAFYNRGIARQSGGQVDAALADYSQAIALNPSNDTAFIHRASIYMERTLFENAIVDYDRAIRLNANVGVAFKGRCYALAAAGRPAQAMVDCERSIQLDPSDPGAFDARGLVHLRLRNYPAAIADYDAALAANPNQANSLYGRGVAKLRSGNAKVGNADIEQAIKVDPNIASTMRRLGLTP